MIQFLIIGTVLGLSAGFAPGPLLTLVISETLQHGIKAGIKVAIAPFITDLPIICLTFLVLSKLSGFHQLVGIISLLGGCFIFYTGFKNLLIKQPDSDFKISKFNSLSKGILANFLNPQPYLFWFSVGAPLLIKAINQSYISALAFIASFYLLLVGSKLLLAILVGKSRSFLHENAYIYIMRFLGLMLFIFAFVLFYDGLELLKVIH